VQDQFLAHKAFKATARVQSAMGTFGCGVTHILNPSPELLSQSGIARTTTALS
jgi:hypothetical protein